jgi:hypothetical protein
MKSLDVSNPSQGPSFVRTARRVHEAADGLYQALVRPDAATDAARSKPWLAALLSCLLPGAG